MRFCVGLSGDGMCSRLACNRVAGYPMFMLMDSWVIQRFEAILV